LAKETRRSLRSLARNKPCQYCKKSNAEEYVRDSEDLQEKVIFNFSASCDRIFTQKFILTTLYIS